MFLSGGQNRNRENGTFWTLLSGKSSVLGLAYTLYLLLPRPYFLPSPPIFSILYLTFYHIMGSCYSRVHIEEDRAATAAMKAKRKRLIELRQIPDEENDADVLTKIVTGRPFRTKARRLLGSDSVLDPR